MMSARLVASSFFALGWVWEEKQLISWLKAESSELITFSYFTFAQAR
jgi:hypothetical protein